MNEPEGFSTTIQPHYLENNPFTEGEDLALEEFLDRFLTEVCAGNARRFHRWPVRVVRESGGEMYLALNLFHQEDPKAGALIPSPSQGEG